MASDSKTQKCRAANLHPVDMLICSPIFGTPARDGTRSVADVEALEGNKVFIHA